MQAQYTLEQVQTAISDLSQLIKQKQQQPFTLDQTLQIQKAVQTLVQQAQSLIDQLKAAQQTISELQKVNTQQAADIDKIMESINDLTKRLTQ